MIDHDRPACTLPAQVPRLRQVERLRLTEQALQGVLVLSEILDARPFATGQAVPRQVAGNHRKALVQRPFDHMPVEPGVVVETVDDKQRRLGSLGPPELADQLITVDLESPKAAAHLTRGKIQPVESLVSLRLRRQRLPGRQWQQACA
ncbi:hypothetical protein D3C81_1617610 [compost metagenome]